MDLKKLPKIELHLHLDGSVRVETAALLLKEDICLVKQEMIANDKCLDLNDYLTKFDLPISIMQTKENLERIAYELCQDLEKENVIYAEIRFAPIKHILKGLTLEEVVDSVLIGLSKGNIKTNLILCMMRDSSYEENLKIINLTKSYLGRGVVGIDLAGAEAIYKTNTFKKLFDEINKLGIKTTIHAGEADGVDSINSALSFNTKRIGHGVNSINDISLINRLIDDKILLEVCPTSNIQTNIVNSYKEHPIKKLYDKGVKVCINTDNRTVSNTTLTEEYNHLINDLNFDISDIIKMNLNAIDGSFLTKNQKKELHNLYLNKLK